MPTITADKVIGKNLIAKVAISKLNGAFQKIGSFAPGSNIGIVFSYIQRNGQVYWMIQPEYGQPFYVLHGPGRFEITQDIKDAQKEQQIEREKEQREREINAKGAIPYYVEKYGKFLLIVVAGAYVLNTYIKKKL